MGRARAVAIPSTRTVRVLVGPDPRTPCAQGGHRRRREYPRTTRVVLNVWADAEVEEEDGAGVGVPEDEGEDGEVGFLVGFGDVDELPQEHVDVPCIERGDFAVGLVRCRVWEVHDSVELIGYQSHEC